MAGLARGYTFCAVTDHSYGLKIARGVSMADLRKQHREIDALRFPLIDAHHDLLRRVLYRYVPKAVLERPKQGFNMPISPRRFLSWPSRAET